jgi:hypothetical protein
MIIVYALISTLLMLGIIKLFGFTRKSELDQNNYHFKARQNIVRNLQQVVNIPIFTLGVILIINYQQLEFVSSIVVLATITLLIYNGKKNVGS